MFVQLSEAFLYVEGELTKLAADTNILTVDNFPLFLFDEIKLEINGKVIDSIKNVGVHAMMKGALVTSEAAENYTSLHVWNKNDHLLETGQKLVHCIPLKMCWGIALITLMHL